MANQLCEHKFRLIENSKLGAHCPDCFPYRVCEYEFSDFDDVVQFAWDNYKIDLNYHDVMDEDLKQQACEQLATMIEELDIL